MKSDQRGGAVPGKFESTAFMALRSFAIRREMRAEISVASLQIENAVKAFAGTPVLKGVSLELKDGEFCVIVGGSGCGKSTLLRAIAGLEELDSGSIFIDGRRIDDLPPAERGIAMVFQSYALYPHLDVFENLAFALRLAKRPAAEIE